MCADNNHQLMRSIIQRVATGPEMSKDIPRDEAREGMRLILENKVDWVQAAVFLIALRMKRETDDEYLGVLEAIQDATTTIVAPIHSVIDIADPYNGFTRHFSVSPFLPVVLAACGIPAVCHGLESVGPKHGLTSRVVLEAAGVNVDFSPEEAGNRISNPHIGWCYLDQKAFCPALHHLVDLRTLIVKRPCLSTIELMAAPIRGRNTTHLVTGFVHRAYPRIYALLARHAGFDSALIVRGTEGGVVPSLRKSSRCFGYTNKGKETEINLDPGEIGIVQSVKATPIAEELSTNENDKTTDSPIQILAKAAAENGLKALNGESGAALDSLILAGSAILWHTGHCKSLQDGAAAVRTVLSNGNALERLTHNYSV